MRSPRHLDTEPEDSLRWSCGEAVWGLLGVAATAGAPLGERLDRQVTILCRPVGLPSLSAAWERKGMLAARVECERMDACPIYVECRRSFDSSGLRETIRAVDAERALILLNITEPSDTTWASAGLSDELYSFLRDIRRNSRSRDSFRCIVLASPSAAAAAYDIFDGYDMAHMLGPYSEIPDTEVLACLCEDAADCRRPRGLRVRTPP